MSLMNETAFDLLFQREFHEDNSSVGTVDRRGDLRTTYWTWWSLENTM